MQRAEDFGLTVPGGPNPGVSIGIGTVEVHPADLVSAYGAIADGGTLVQRNMILSITDSKGVVWAGPHRRPPRRRTRRRRQAATS
jgi:membrane peptidoglycan carboxypeptidase